MIQLLSGRVKAWKVFLCVIVGFLAMPAYAAYIQGSCEELRFRTGPNGKADWPYQVKVLRGNAPLYADATTAVTQGTLTFDSTLEVLDATSDRIEVRLIGNPKSLGWMNRMDLLCGVSPLKGNSGLEQKFYIKTPTKTGDKQISTVKAYRSPDLQNCGEQACKELSRFNGDFIFAQSPTGFLLSGSYRLTETEPLVGWIDQNDGFIWDTAYGLRPREDLVFPAGHALAGQERAICAYLSIDDTLTNQNCQPILGGKRWYLDADRIPILNWITVDGHDFYRVLLSLPNVLGDETITETYIPVSEDVVAEVMLTSSDLSRYIILLDLIGSMPANSGAELRENFVRTLIDSLEKVIREPLYKDTGENMEDYLKRKAGLPVRKHSPLFRHSIDELRDPNRVPNCELNLLSKWVFYVTQMLSIVQTGISRPVYEVKAYDGSCPSGQDIPLINDDPRTEKLGDDTSMRYDHVFQNAQIYWVPEEFLP